MDYYQLGSRPSYQDSLMVIEADIHHANLLFPQMGSQSSPRMEGEQPLENSTRLHGSELEIHQDEIRDFEMIVQTRLEEKREFSNVDLEREDECGICLEPCTKMVLPNCCHAMCINCYRDWNMRSESCPFCRGSLKRVNSGDLWVLTCSGDVVDAETVSKEDMLRFYVYINNLPKDVPDALFLVYYEYLI